MLKILQSDDNGSNPPEAASVQVLYTNLVLLYVSQLLCLLTYYELTLEERHYPQ